MSQTDGAPGLETLGVPGKVTHLGCWAHLRRYLVKARIADFRPHRWSPPTPVQAPTPEALQA